MNQVRHEVVSVFVMFSRGSVSGLMQLKQQLKKPTLHIAVVSLSYKVNKVECVWCVQNDGGAVNHNAGVAGQQDNDGHDDQAAAEVRDDDEAIDDHEDEDDVNDAGQGKSSVCVWWRVIMSNMSSCHIMCNVVVMLYCVSCGDMWQCCHHVSCGDLW